jgi:uncharacterized protein HemY
VLIAGAFYLGLRASEWFKQQSSNGTAAGAAAEPLRRGVEAFDRSDFQSAALEFDAAAKLEPSNALVHYWLGRSRLEQHDYQQASLSFEQAVALRPSFYDAYVQAAAAYELMGERAKALSMLTRGAEERKKQQQR